MNWLATVLKVFSPDDKEAAKKNLEACVQSLGHQKRWEMRKVREDGTRKNANRS
jgi:hypothetical protein